jgi:large subunit ribosomal protein L18
MSKTKTEIRRVNRVRGGIRRAAASRLRLSVFRSSKHIYCQVIDDTAGETVASASSIEKDLRGQAKGSDRAAANRVGKLLAERAIAAGVKDVVFDRGRYRFHGRVKALADGAREGGLKF